MGGATESTKKMYYTAEEEEEEEEEAAAVMMPIMCGDLFDDLLDFPNDADDIMMLGGGGGGMVDPSSCADAHHGGVSFTPATTLQNEPPLILPPPLHVECDDGLLGGAQGGVMMPNAGPTSNNTRATTTTLNGEDDKVFENLDIADMEWFSSFIYDTADSFSLGLPTAADIGGGDASRDNKEESMFRTSSPVSVLEPNRISSGGGGSSASSSSSSCSGDNAGGSNGGRALVPVSPPLAFVSSVPARARSKRPRTTTFSPRTHVAISFLPIQSPDCPPLPLPAPEPESFGESITPPTMVKKKKKKKKKSSPPSDGGGEEEAGPPAARKCAHCQIQKTPQWRAGPLGPKTLCNACGVRYKSGRLFPEYRPAASPTFVSSIHSNSHKKVVEMRLKSSVPGIVSPKSCDLLDYIRRRE